MAMSPTFTQSDKKRKRTAYDGSKTITIKLTSSPVRMGTAKDGAERNSTLRTKYSLQIDPPPGPQYNHTPKVYGSFNSKASPKMKSSFASSNKGGI